LARQQAVHPGPSGADLDLREAVLEAIESHDVVRESRTQVEVSVEDGVVTLGGVALTASMRRRILYAAATVPGVHKVIDRMYDDEELKVTVAQTLAADPALQNLPRPIGVTSYQGAITLYGRVASDEQQAAAVAAASQVAGVRRVTGNLTVLEADDRPSTRS
jgi:osmotically-inducible protein OsmY